MNADELNNKLTQLIPNQDALKQVRVVVARKKKRGGYDVYPCVTDVTLVNIPLPGEKSPMLTIVFES